MQRQLTVPRSDLKRHDVSLRGFMIHIAKVRIQVEADRKCFFCFGRKIKTADKDNIIFGRNRNKNEKSYLFRSKTKNNTKK